MGSGESAQKQERQELPPYSTERFQTEGLSPLSEDIMTLQFVVCSEHGTQYPQSIPVKHTDLRELCPYGCQCCVKTFAVKKVGEAHISVEGKQVYSSTSQGFITSPVDEEDYGNMYGGKKSSSDTSGLDSYNEQSESVSTPPRASEISGDETSEESLIKMKDDEDVSSSEGGFMLGSDINSSELYRMQSNLFSTFSEPSEGGMDTINSDKLSRAINLVKNVQRGKIDSEGIMNAVSSSDHFVTKKLKRNPKYH
jgi:hypothetical protein